MTPETEAAIEAALAALDLSAYQRRRVRAAAAGLAEKPQGDTIETITRVNKLRTLCQKAASPLRRYRDGSDADDDASAPSQLDSPAAGLRTRRRRGAGLNTSPSVARTMPTGCGRCSAPRAVKLRRPSGDGLEHAGSLRPKTPGSHSQTANFRFVPNSFHLRTTAG
jgi:hypothetical protein